MTDVLLLADLHGNYERLDAFLATTTMQSSLQAISPTSVRSSLLIQYSLFLKYPVSQSRATATPVRSSMCSNAQMRSVCTNHGSLSAT